MSLTRNTLKDLRALARRNFREEEDLFLIEGFRLMAEAANSNFEFVEVYLTHRVAEDPQAKALLHKLQLKAKLVTVTEKELESFTDTVQAQGIAAVMRQRHVSPESLLRHDDGRSIIVAADAISDPGNLGSMIRSCDWFAIDAMALGTNSVDLYNPKVVRSTMGGLFHLPIVDKVDLPAFLSKAKSSGYTLYVTDDEGTTHFDRIQYPSKSLVVFGNEAWGVSEAVKKLADARVVIRRYGTGDSLNVGVACGIVLSSIRRLYE